MYLLGPLHSDTNLGRVKFDFAVDFMRYRYSISRILGIMKDEVVLNEWCASDRANSLC